MKISVITLQVNKSVLAQPKPLVEITNSAKNIPYWQHFCFSPPFWCCDSNNVVVGVRSK